MQETTKRSLSCRRSNGRNHVASFQTKKLPYNCLQQYIRSCFWVHDVVTGFGGHQSNTMLAAPILQHKQAASAFNWLSWKQSLNDVHQKPIITSETNCETTRVTENGYKRPYRLSKLTEENWNTIFVNRKNSIDLLWWSNETRLRNTS